MRRIAGIGCSLVGAWWLAASAAAQEPVPDALCLLCHEVETPTTRRVDELPAPVGTPFHERASCVDCHVDLRSFDLEALEHDPAVAPAACTACHSSVRDLVAGTPHDLAGVSCARCHGGHEVMAVHDADAPVAAGRLNALCTSCHSDIASSDPSDPHSHALTGRSCLACHSPHSPAPPASLLDDQSCLDCHDVGDLELPSGFALPVTAGSSVHGQAGVRCVLCHADLSDTEEFPHGSDGGVRCDRCHPAAAVAWELGVHARALETGSTAADCKHCHGTHDIQPIRDPRSRVFALNLPDTCESCHRPQPPEEHPAPAGAKVAAYETSVHGRGLRVNGLIVTATCSSCHGSHQILPAADPEAPTSRQRVPYTCGACHTGILNGYLSGVHGEDFLGNVADVPVCTDCHGEHGIGDPGQPGTSVSREKVAETCARCHADDSLVGDYGLSSRSFLSWGRSYHGIAAEFGRSDAANCASCHGFHAVFASTDPRSPVHAANLEQTCGTCHPSAATAFAKVPVHGTVERQDNYWAWLIGKVYLILIAVVIGAFLLFIAADLFGRLRLRLGIGPPEPQLLDPAAIADEDELFPPDDGWLRLGVQARIQHGLLVTSFLLLVATGLPLLLHELPLLRAFLDFEGGYELRSRLHRIGAVGLIGLSLWHVAAIALHPRGRRWALSMIIRPRDVRDFLHEACFAVGLSRSRPRGGRYGLVEKLEYAAVVWGNLVMIASGLFLWRPGWFLGWLPGWTFDVCRVVHGLEATLAFLAIIIWHMYHVHLRPDVFPMSMTWLTGRMSREELKSRHPAWYLEILARRRATRRRTGVD